MRASRKSFQPGLHDILRELYRIRSEVAAACELSVERLAIGRRHKDAPESCAGGCSGLVRWARGARMRAEAEEAAVSALLLASFEEDRTREEQQLGVEQLAVGQRWRAVGGEREACVVEQRTLCVVQTRGEHVEPRGHTTGSATVRTHEFVRFERTDEEKTGLRLLFAVHVSVVVWWPYKRHNPVRRSQELVARW